LVWGQTAGAGGWPDDPTPVAIIDFQVHKTISNGIDWEDMGRAVFGLNVGDTVTPESLAAALIRFDAFGQADIQVDVLSQGPEQGELRRGLALIIDLTPYRRIKSIHFDNIHPLFESDVRGIMTIAPGAIFDPKTVQAQGALIAARYRMEGYIDPKVQLKWDEDQDGHILLEVIVEKGPAFLTAEKEFTGNQAMTDGQLKGQLARHQWGRGLFGGSRFSEEHLKKEVAYLTALYRKAGYADARVVSHVIRHVKDRQVQVKFHIEEGPCYHIEFAGNRFFSARALKKDISLFETGNRGNVGLRRSIRNLRNRYLQAGFADVRVHREEVSATDLPRPDTSSTNQPEKEPSGRRIRIHIDEGRRHIVERVAIQGNARISDETIREQMLTRPPNGFKKGLYVARTLEEDLDAVLALYIQDGFLDARVSKDVNIDPDSKMVSVMIAINEGVQTTVGDITFSGQLPLDEKALRAVLQLRPNQPFQPYMVENEQHRVSARISAMGYPYVQTKGAVILSEDKTRANITYDIDSGPLVNVGKIFFAGNFRARHGILDRELGFGEGDVFSLNKVMTAQRNLRDLDLFESVQVHTIGLKERDALVHLLFETPEKRPYYFEFAGGYTTDKGFYGRSKWGDNNFAGTNKDIWISGELAETGYQWDAGIGDPHFLGSRIRADAGIFGEHLEEFNQDFGTDSAGSTLNFKRKWGRHIITSLGFQYEHRTQFPRNGAQTDDDPDAYEERIFLVTTPYVGYDTRDSFIRPTKGIYSNLSVDISSGLKGSLDNFLRYSFDLRGYTTLYADLTLAAVGRAGYLTPMGADDALPEDQLFFLGGTTDVRGYGENLFRYDDNGDPVGGRLALSTSLEARYDLGADFELALFLDGGSLQVAPSDEGEDDWRWSAGLGLRYITPIGPIGLLYGFKLAPDPDEDPGQLHFSIGYTF
jgi:outer membrane protein insertion porin family